MWEVCYSEFHWKLIAGLMGLPKLLATSSIPLEFSLQISPWEEAEERWTGSRMVNAGLAGEYWESWDPSGCLIFTFSHAPCSCCATMPEGSLLETGKCAAGHSTTALPFTCQWPFSIYPSGWSRKVGVCSLWMFPKLGSLPYGSTARSEVGDEAVSQCRSSWEGQAVLSALWPVTQETNLILWPMAPFSPNCFQAWQNMFRSYT